MLDFLLFGLVTLAAAGPATENYKDQFCTDPRTMQKHQAYTEWADAYSCTRHRCQPGGRNLAIYTVGCKRVEAPESAIECEEVVEDTNMQFPYCCTRLRCLVVVRGEVWTRVLGQPWETLPAAPWSHMYKMKKPPPGDGSFLPKVPNEGPVYELTSDGEDGQKVLRTNKKMSTESPDCNEIAPRAVPAPDIVIALSTNADQKDHKKREPLTEPLRSYAKRHHKPQNPYYEDEMPDHRNEDEEQTEKAIDAASDEKSYLNAYAPTQKPYKHHQAAWTEVPQTPWHEDITDVRQENEVPRVSNILFLQDGSHQPEFPPTEEKTPAPFKDEKPANLQALVDAIGTRMRDIENVVQRMSEKVHQSKPTAPEPYNSAEKRAVSDSEIQPAAGHKRHSKERSKDRTKRPNADDHYKRFSVRNRGSKYLHAADGTTDQPLFVEDTNMNGYFSDASNNLLRRVNPPKLRRDNYNSKSNERVVPEVLEEHEHAHEQAHERTENHAHERAENHAHERAENHARETTHDRARETTHEEAHIKCNHTVHAPNRAQNSVEPAATYMAPVENRRKAARILTSDMSDEGEKKKKKHSHKRKKSKGSKGKRSRKHNKEKKKHVAKVSSELDRNQERNVDRNVERNVVSLEDSSALAS